MTVGNDNQLISKILESPNAPKLLDDLNAYLLAEKAKRVDFYNEITEQEKAEFINGEIIIHSPVKMNHNQVNGNIFMILNTYVIEKELGFVGIEKILIQCTRNDYEPDLCYFDNKTSLKFKQEQSLFPIPQLIVEVLSKSTEKRDRGIKFEDYQNHKVKEYWIVDPKKKVIEQYVLNKKNKFELILKSNSGEIRSSILKGLVIPIKSIFDTKKNQQFVKKLLLDNS